MTTRRVHEAMETTVEQSGTAAPRALYAAFRKFNAEHFGGKLGAPLIWIGACSPRALGDYCGRDVHGLESRIRISDAAIRRGVEFATWVLLHEMVHAWCHEVEKDGERGYRGHGPKFAAKCNEIGRTYGFRECAAKGRRKGMPECAQWPFSVMGVRLEAEGRPEGEAGAAGEPAAAPPCLHCGKKAATLPRELPRFCASRCATAWLVEQTAGLVWCAEHGWTRAGDGGGCGGCTAPASERHLRCA